MNAPVRELDDLWRVYTREWVHMYTAEPGAVTALEHYDSNYAGRVASRDVRFVVAFGNPNRVQLELFLHVMKAEFKDIADAQAFAAEHFPDDHDIVARNSARDHELRNYGVKRLAR